MNAPPRAAAIGDNSAQAAAYGKDVAERLGRDYAELAASVASILDEARALPKEIDSDETMGKFASLIKRLRDTAGRIDAFHRAEKEPFLRGGQATDSFFFGLWDKVAKRAKNNNPGAADILQFRVDAYMTAKLEAERERRRKEAEEAARAEAEKREAELKALRDAEEARQAAERARKPERIEEKTEIAVEKQAVAGHARVESLLARDAAEAAATAAAAKSADMVRTRFDDAMVTARRVPFVQLVDRDAIDKAKLWPFFSDAEIERALKAWAKTTGHKVPMPGAVVEMRDDFSVR